MAQTDREIFEGLKEGAGGKYDQKQFIQMMKGKLVTANKAHDISVECTAQPADFKDKKGKIVDWPVKLPAIRRVLNALVTQERALKKSRSYNNKDAFYVLSNEELEAEGIEEDDEALRKLIAVKTAKKKEVVVEDFDEDEDDEFDDEDFEEED